MPKYVKVTISGPYGTDEEYEPCDEGESPTDEEVHAIGQGIVNDRYSWSARLVAEEDVPYDCRF